MSGITATIKNAIKAKLDALTPAILKTVIIDDFHVNPVIENIPLFPAAIMNSPATESVRDTNRENLRTHIFEIIVIQKGENITSVNDIEELREAILDAFDNDGTLGGTANGSVDPSTSSPQSITLGDKTYIVFAITLKARALFTIT
jgi:hypothetical protein